jgi:hypothetical protein
MARSCCCCERTDNNNGETRHEDRPTADTITNPTCGNQHNRLGKPKHEGNPHQILDSHFELAPDVRESNTERINGRTCAEK